MQLNNSAMNSCECLLFVLKRSYVCYYLIGMTAFKEKCRKKHYPFYIILFNVYDVLLISIKDIRYPMRKLFTIAFLL